MEGESFGERRMKRAPSERFFGNSEFGVKFDEPRNGKIIAQENIRRILGKMISIIMKFGVSLTEGGELSGFLHRVP